MCAADETAPRTLPHTAATNRVATLWTLLIPFLLSSFLLMFGNWWVPSALPAGA